MAKKKATAAKTKTEPLKKQLDVYKRVFGEIEKFLELIATQEQELKTATLACHEAKDAYDQAKQEVASNRDLLAGTHHSLFKFLQPGPAEILPLFDRMDPADEEKHGVRSDEWRREPIAALGLSLVASTLLTDADVIFVGQLQDRVQAVPENWWEVIDGLTAPVAAAIADKLNEFINERTGK